MEVLLGTFKKLHLVEFVHSIKTPTGLHDMAVNNSREGFF